MIAILQDHSEIVQLLLAKKDVNLNIQDVLIQNHSWYFNLILSLRIYNCNHLWSLVWAFNQTALIIATNKNHIEIVRLLLAHEDIDVNIQEILMQNHLSDLNTIIFILF